MIYIQNKSNARLNVDDNVSDKCSYFLSNLKQFPSSSRIADIEGQFRISSEGHVEITVTQ